MKAIRYKLAVSDGEMGAAHGCFWTITEYFFPDVGLVLNRDGAFLDVKPRYIKDKPEEGIAEFSLNPEPEPDPEPKEIEVDDAMASAVLSLASSILKTQAATEFLRANLYALDIAQEDAIVKDRQRELAVWDEKMKKIALMLKEKHMRQWVAIEDTPEGLIVVAYGKTIEDVATKLKGKHHDALFEVTTDLVTRLVK